MSPSGPFWQPPRRADDTHLPAQVDVVVIGGGLTGAAIARRLVAEHTSVVVLERDRPASGASGRNAGFLLTGVAANYASAVRRYGRATAAEIWRFTMANHELFAAAIEGDRAGYRRHGSWVLPASAEERAELEESVQLLGEDGFPGEWRDAAPRSGSGFTGGLLNPFDGEVEPAAAVSAMARSLPVSTGAEVLAIEPGRGGVRVHLAAGEIAASRVVVATNGYTHRLLPGVAIRPVRAQMLATAPVGEQLTDRPVYSDFGYRYWRQLGDGRVLLGGFRNTAVDAEVGDDDTPTAAVQDRLDEHLQALGVDAPVTHRWAGTMGFSPDELPIVGAVSGMPGVFVCGGYSGHGLGFALGCAAALVDSWASAPIPAWLDSARFAPAART